MHQILSWSSSTHFKLSFAPDITREKITSLSTNNFPLHDLKQALEIGATLLQMMVLRVHEVQRSALKHHPLPLPLHVLLYTHLYLLRGGQSLSLNNSGRIYILSAPKFESWVWIITSFDRARHILWEFRFNLIQIFTSVPSLILPFNSKRKPGEIFA